MSDYTLCCVLLPFHGFKFRLNQDFQDLRISRMVSLL